jgi:hypothetical protein
MLITSYLLRKRGMAPVPLLPQRERLGEGTCPLEQRQSVELRQPALDGV